MYKTHVFICTNSPDNPERCGHKGSESLRREVKEICAKLYPKSKDSSTNVRVNSSGCLGYCEQGIAAVIYPQGIWIKNLTKDSSEDLLREIARCQAPLEERNK